MLTSEFSSTSLGASVLLDEPPKVDDEDGRGPPPRSMEVRLLLLPSSKPARAPTNRGTTWTGRVTWVVTPPLVGAGRCAMELNMVAQIGVRSSAIREFKTAITELRVKNV